MSKRRKRGVSRREVAMGMRVEREHDDVTGGDPRLVRRIVLAHLRERPDYYRRLARCVENPFLPLSRVLALPRHDRSGKDALPWSRRNVARLVRSLRKDGWDTERPVKVTVRRDGSLFVDEGNHRLAAAAIVGMSRVPVEFFRPDGLPATVKMNPARSERQRRLFGTALACRCGGRCAGPRVKRLARLPLTFLSAMARRRKRRGKRARRG